MQNWITLDFADGEYDFALPVAHVEELQKKCGIGIGGLHARTLKGHVVVGNELIQVPTEAEFHVSDIVETIRHGLIGGGKGRVNGEEVLVSPTRANQLVAMYVAGAPLKANWSIAASILIACVMGYDPPKKGGPADQPAPTETQTAD